MLRVHLSFEESQNLSAFWEWGMGNGEWERKSFCKIEMHRMLMFVKRDVNIEK